MKEHSALTQNINKLISLAQYSFQVHDSLHQDFSSFLM
jgi:hypothetical protein